MSVRTQSEAVPPTSRDVRIARASSEALAAVLSDDHEAKVRVSAEGGRETEITLPASAVRLLQSALREMAKGRIVTLIPVEAEFTTQQAADMMQVSRPYLIKLLDTGKLPYRKLGSHRRIRYDDLSAYVDKERAARKETLKELIAEQERLGLYE